MKKFFSRLILVMLSFTWLVSSATEGVVPEGKVYTSKQNLFRVDIPYATSALGGGRTNYRMVDGTVPQANTDFVDFALHPSYWMSGVFAADFQPGMNKPSAKAFYAFLKQGAPTYIKNNGFFDRDDVRIISFNTMDFKGHPAIQFIAVGTVQEGLSGVLIVTAVNYKNGLATIRLLQQVDMNKPIKPQINWVMYNHFLNSFRAL